MGYFDICRVSEKHVAFSLKTFADNISLICFFFCCRFLLSGLPDLISGGQQWQQSTVMAMLTMNCLIVSFRELRSIVDGKKNIEKPTRLCIINHRIAGFNQQEPVSNSIKHGIT